MKHKMALVAAAGLALFSAFAPMGPAYAEDCLGKLQIQKKIDLGELKQVSEAMDDAGVDGKIISSGAEVCLINGRWQWRVNVMDAYGESRPVILPAD